MLKLSEKDLQNYGTRLLEMDGWRHLRTDPVSDRRRGKGFGEIGMADDLYIRYHNEEAVWRDDPARYPSTPIFARSRCQLLWIEFKRKGGKPTKAQLAWHDTERKRGALTLIVGLDFEATPEGFYGWYKQSGLMRKAILPPKGATM